MAETEYRDVRVEETLRVKIGEAKNLPSASSASGGRTTCCAIKIDSEEIFRTSPVEKSRDPYYNAEFQGEIPKKFRHLSVYVYDVSNRNNKVIGKVSLKKEELYKFHQKDHWFPLVHQDGNTEVQGKVQMEVRLGEVLSPSSTDNTTHRLAVRVCECSDLTVINGACNPYAVVSLSYGNSRHKEVKRTAVRKKTICPQFDEKFFFYFDKGQNQDKTNYAFDDFMSGELSVSLFHDDSKVSREVLGNMFKGTFLGEVKIPVRDIDVSKPHKAWYCLQAKESHRSSQQPLGSLRLRISYSADYVFPSKYYNGLRELVLESAEAQHITSSTAFILGEVVSNREDAAKPLVKLFLHHGRLVPLIHALADWEMSNTIDPNTLFRGNSLLTKMVDELMKLMGIPYLRDTLKSFIDQVVSEAKPCEIDPTRLKEGDEITANLGNLFGYVSDCINNIVNSGLVCPSVMRDVFSTLKARAMLNYPDNAAVRHHAVTSFIFLRFFTAAILTPTMFDLHSNILDAPVQRTLTLISKSISGVVNCISSKSNSITAREEYMAPLFDMFSKSVQMDIRLFLDIISSSSGCHFRGIEAPILLKEGFLIKRAQGRKKFGLKNFKKRFFRLTNQSLSYSKNKGDKYLFEIPINDILVVERLAESSFKMKYMFQVVHAQTALYIQASNCVEEKEWLDILMKICKSNKNRLKFYHPAAFVNGHWLCCKSFEQTTAGCTPVSGGLPLADIQADIDSDREVEKIHSLFLTEIDKLDALQAYVEDELGATDACGSQAVYTGEVAPQPPWQEDSTTGGLTPNPPVSPTHSNCQGSPVSNTSGSFPTTEGVLMLGASIEDPGTCYVTLLEIQRCVITLEQEHIQYMRSVQRRTVIGSIDTPIGDESCADLVRNIYRSSERLSRHGSRSSNASNVSYRSYRGSRSRGGSFRERDGIAGGGGRRGRKPAEGVRKSLSGDVSSSGRNLGVEFKSEVKKAASYDVMSCDVVDDAPQGGASDDRLGSINKKPVFTVGRKDTESFSESSRTESSGGYAAMSVSSGGKENALKPERSNSNAEADDVFLTDPQVAKTSSQYGASVARSLPQCKTAGISPRAVPGPESQDRVISPVTAQSTPSLPSQGGSREQSVEKQATNSQPQEFTSKDNGDNSCEPEMSQHLSDTSSDSGRPALNGRQTLPKGSPVPSELPTHLGLQNQNMTSDQETSATIQSSSTQSETQSSQSNVETTRRNTHPAFSLPSVIRQASRCSLPTSSLSHTKACSVSESECEASDAETISSAAASLPGEPGSNVTSESNNAVHTSATSVKGKPVTSNEMGQDCPVPTGAGRMSETFPPDLHQKYHGGADRQNNISPRDFTGSSFTSSTAPEPEPSPSYLDRGASSKNGKSKTVLQNALHLQNPSRESDSPSSLHLHMLSSSSSSSSCSSSTTSPSSPRLPQLVLQKKFASSQPVGEDQLDAPQPSSSSTLSTAASAIPPQQQQQRPPDADGAAEVADGEAATAVDVNSVDIQYV